MDARRIRVELDEIEHATSAETCLRCGSSGASLQRPAVALDASLQNLDEYLPHLPLCPSCAQAQAKATAHAWLSVLAVPYLQLLALIVVVLVPIPSPIAPLAALVVASVAGIFTLRWARRRAGRHCPVLVLSGEGRSLDLQVADLKLAARPREPGPYRSPLGRDDGAPPVVRYAALQTGGAMTTISLIIGSMAMAYAYPQCYPMVVLDNWENQPATVVVDGNLEVSLDALDERQIRLRAGIHQFSTKPIGRFETETMDAWLPVGQNHLLSVPGEHCYAVGARSFAEARRFGFRPTERLTTWNRSGRWIKIGDPRFVASGRCDDPAPGLLLWH